ncbi:hypothetical protein PRUPE_5G197800 [Prunus persica]|uniref:Response regulatory domain-containing protein n=1 Tax=Prunus persica TaxID=3760 RepID=A0A251PEB3_PRUPE|nr:hypothetical protein PRUPE_5G197800 [Prunus persica]
MEKGKQIDIGNGSRQHGGSRAKSKNMSIDRSRVRVLLCDRDAESCEEVCTLLTTCCYQVLSTQNESRFLYNFLKFGATDYLVKPLCIDEILNMWIHSWRQRKPPKGLEPPQKSISLVVSAEATTNNILVLDDTTRDEEFPEDPEPTLCVSKK